MRTILQSSLFGTGLLGAGFVVTAAGIFAVVDGIALGWGGIGVGGALVVAAYRSMGAR